MVSLRIIHRLRAVIITKNKNVYDFLLSFQLPLDNEQVSHLDLRRECIFSVKHPSNRED